MLVTHTKTGGAYAIISQNVRFTHSEAHAYPSGPATLPAFSAYLEADSEWLFSFQCAGRDDEVGMAKFIALADSNAPVNVFDPYVAYVSLVDGTIWLRPYDEFWGIVKATEEDALMKEFYRFDVVQVPARAPINN